MALAAVGLFLIGYQWGNQFQRANDAPPRIDGVLLRPSVELPEVELHGTSGTVTRADLRAHWSLIAFGSPGSALGQRGIARLIDVWNRAADQPQLRDSLRLLLISADDAPALARDFERLTPNLKVLSTSREDLSRLQDAFGIADARGREAGDQPPPIYLLSPQARLAVLFTGSQPAQRIAEDLKALAERPDALAAPPETTNHG